MTHMEGHRQPPAFGEVAPWFTAPCDDNPRFAFDSVGGYFVVLMFFGSLRFPGSKEALSRIVAARELFDDMRALFFGVSIDPEDRKSRGLKGSPPGLRYFADDDKAISRAYGLVADTNYKPAVLLLDQSLRVIGSGPLPATDDLLAQLRSELAASAESLPSHAPVLTVPRVFEPAFCRALIAHYEAVGGSSSGFMRQQGDKTVKVNDPQFKRRSDVLVADDALKAGLRARLVYRLFPMIQRSFGWSPGYVERYLVACYDAADQGFFRAHRDNTTAGTAHRRLAVTINLNAEDYEGGELVFPEYGRRAFKPPTGGASVFGCGLLHEVQPVRSGRRYAYLPFLYDEEAAAIRRRNQSSLEPDDAPASAAHAKAG